MPAWLLGRVLETWVRAKGWHLLQQIENKIENSKLLVLLGLCFLSTRAVFPFLGSDFDTQTRPNWSREGREWMDNLPTKIDILLIVNTLSRYIKFLALHCLLLSFQESSRGVLKCFRPWSALPNNYLLKVCVGKNIEKVSIVAQYSNNILFCQMVN